MKNAGSLLNQFLGAGSGMGGKSGGDIVSALTTGKGGLATGAVVGGLAGLVMGGKKPKKMAKTALKVGGAALVGGLAYKAYRGWQENKSTQASAAPVQEVTPPQNTVFMPAIEAQQDDLSTALIRAMINAAKADGHINNDERARISEQLNQLQIDASHQQFLEEELAKPMDVEAVAKSVNCPEQAAEVYLASLLVVDREAPAEKGYLAMLAARLQLEPALVEHLHASVDSAVAA